MIIYYIFEFFKKIGDVLTNTFGSVTELPYGTDVVFVEYWGWMAFMMQALWPLQAIVGCAVSYAGWRIGVKVYHKIFGSRAVIN